MEFDALKPETVFSLKKADITKTLLVQTFATINSKKAPTLPANTKITITDELVKKYNCPIGNFTNYKDMIGVETTIGRIVTHIFLFDIDINFKNAEGVDVVGNLNSLIPFTNSAFNKKTLDSVDGIVSDLYIEGDIDSKVMEMYINHMQWMGYTSAIFMLPSLDLSTVDPSKKIRDYRDKALRDNKDVINRKDVVAFSAMEKDVLAFAAKELDATGASGKMIYDSGFNGTWNNNFKTTSIFRGVAPKSDDTTQYEIATSNLVDGVSKKDIPAHADLAVLGAAGRAKDTQLGGYKTKIFSSAFSSLIAAKKGTDCGTKGFNLELITNYRDYRYRYIIDGDKLVMLDKSNKNKYVGKVVKLRTPIFCTSQQICNKCLGDMFYKLKVRYIGLHTTRITSALMNASMKAFHNMAVVPESYDLLDYIK